jgi:hypothetical protein
MSQWCSFFCGAKAPAWSHTLLLTRGTLGFAVLIGLAYVAHRKDWETASALLGIAAFGVLIWHVVLWLS